MKPKGNDGTSWYILRGKKSLAQENSSSNSSTQDPEVEAGPECLKKMAGVGKYWHYST